MLISLKSSKIVKSFSALLSFTDTKSGFYFYINNSSLLVYNRDSSGDFKDCFNIPTDSVERPLNKEFFVPYKFIKSIARLKSSLIEEDITFEFNEEDRTVSISSKLNFTFPLEVKVLDSPPAFNVGDVDYLPTESVKLLSKYITKLSKDNFKGCFQLSPTKCIFPGTHQITILNLETGKNTSGLLSLKSSQLNKLLKLGQDLSITSSGEIISSEDIGYLIRLETLEPELHYLEKISELESLYTSTLPKLSILEPKFFKDLLKNASTEDKEYDLCRISVEKERVIVNFFRDKQRSNNFVYNKVETPGVCFELNLQTKHLLALTELASEKLEFTFSSSFVPTRVFLGNNSTMYLMPGVVV